MPSKSNRNEDSEEDSDEGDVSKYKLDDEDEDDESDFDASKYDLVGEESEKSDIKKQRWNTYLS